MGRKGITLYYNNKIYLNYMTDEYKDNTNARIVLDYVSGMTDEYFNEQFDKLNIKIVE